MNDALAASIRNSDPNVSREDAELLAEVFQSLISQAAGTASEREQRLASIGRRVSRRFPSSGLADYAARLREGVVAIEAHGFQNYLARGVSQPDWVSGELEKRTISMQRGVLMKCDDALFALRKRGVRLSFSGLIELALRELFTEYPVTEYEAAQASDPAYDPDHPLLEVLAQEYAIGARRKPSQATESDQ